MEMPSLETFTPADLERELNSFALVIDKEGTFADETIDGIGIGRTFAGRNCASERTVQFYASRHRTDRGVSTRYRIEDKDSTHVETFPPQVVELLEADGTEIDDDAVLWVDHNTWITFTPADGHIMLERERVFGAEETTILEVPLLGGVPIYDEEVDLEEEADQRLIGNDHGLYVAELVLRKVVETEDTEDPLEALLQADDSEAAQVARHIQEMLRLVDVLRP